MRTPPWAKKLGDGALTELVSKEHMSVIERGKARRQYESVKHTFRWVALGVIATCVAAYYVMQWSQGPYEKPPAPVKTEQKDCIYEDHLYIEGIEFGSKMFDVDCDKIPDKGVLYPMMANGKISEYPYMYWSDLNKDGGIDPEEVIVDDKMDGLNGNERHYLEPKSSDRRDLEGIIPL